MFNYFRFAIAIAAVFSFSAITAGDDDFHFQGEYVGNLNGGPVGLQVIALGKGQFDAVVYRGGLPGNGWDQATKWSLKGERIEQVATLVGENLRVEVKHMGGNKMYGHVQDAAGRQVGSLQKVYRESPTMHVAAPYGATILFDGSPPKHLKDATINDDGTLNVGATTTEPVGDFRLHMEFRLPYMPEKRGQGRGNSGVYIQRRYEVQILDSFGLEGKANECGGLYRQRPPDINMCLPPLTWQTYDIFFTASRWDDEGNKTDNARITVLHNGVAVHDNVDIKAKTGAGRPEGLEKLPIQWQNHGNPVHFRNMWIVHGDPSIVATWSSDQGRYRIRRGCRKIGLRRRR